MELNGVQIKIEGMRYVVDETDMEKWYNQESQEDLKTLKIKDFNTYMQFCQNKNWVLSELSHRLEHPRYGPHLRETLGCVLPGKFACLKKLLKERDILLEAQFDFEIEKNKIGEDFEKAKRFIHYRIKTLRDYNNTLENKLMKEKLNIFEGAMKMPFLAQLYEDMKSLGEALAHEKWRITPKYSDFPEEEIKMRIVEAAHGSKHLYNPPSGLPHFFFEGVKLEEMSKSYQQLKTQEKETFGNLSIDEQLTHVSLPINLKTTLRCARDVIEGRVLKEILMNYGEYRHHFPKISVTHGGKQISIEEINKLRKEEKANDPNNPLKVILRTSNFNEMLGHLEGKDETEDACRWLGAHLDKLKRNRWNVIPVRKNGIELCSTLHHLAFYEPKSAEKLRKMEERFQRTTKREMQETTNWIISNFFVLHPSKIKEWKIVLRTPNEEELNLPEILYTRCKNLGGRLCVKNSDGEELSLGELCVETAHLEQIKKRDAEKEAPWHWSG